MTTAAGTVPRITFRPIRSDDAEFLYRVFASTRPDVAVSNLGEQEKAEFLQMQFRAQHADYQTKFSNADFLIVLVGNDPAGRLYVHRSSEAIHIIDLALLPSCRGKGTGLRLMAELLKEGQFSGKPVRTYVEHYNRALPWYERLGFVMIADIQTHYLMEWQPSRKIVTSDTDSP